MILRNDRGNKEQGNQKIQVLDTGFEVRYNLSNDISKSPVQSSGERERERERERETMDDALVNRSEERGEQLFENIVKATIDGPLTPDDMIDLIAPLAMGKEMRRGKDRAIRAMRWFNWSALEKDMRGCLLQTLQDFERIDQDPTSPEFRKMRGSQHLYIQSKVMESMIWHRWDADGEAEDVQEDRGRWVIKALENFEAAGGSLIEEEDGGWNWAFASVMDCSGDEVPQELRNVFSIAAALLWGE